MSACPKMRKVHGFFQAVVLHNLQYGFLYKGSIVRFASDDFAQPCMPRVHAFPHIDADLVGVALWRYWSRSACVLSEQTD